MIKVSVLLISAVGTASAHCSYVHTAIENSGNSIYGWVAGGAALAAMLVIRIRSEKQQGKSDV